MASRGGRGGGGGPPSRGGGRGGGGRGHRGGGGDGPPRGGGGGRGGRTPPKPHPGITFYTESTKDQVALKQKFGKGWLAFDFASKEEVQLQPYKGQPASLSQSTIPVSVNHFRLANFRLPKNIYHYEVTMEWIKRQKQSSSDKDEPDEKAAAAAADDVGGGGEGALKSSSAPPRRLPKPLPQLILQVITTRIRRELNFYGIVTDFSNNLYSTKELEGLISLEQIVNMSEVDSVILQETDDGNVKVRIERTPLEIDTSGLNEQLSRFRTLEGFDIPANVKTPLEMVYNAVVKAMPDYRFLPLGRSMATWPDGHQGCSPLDWKIETWSGVSAHIHMGWHPYLNVDIAYNVFLKDIKVMEAVKGELNREIRAVKDLKSREFEQVKKLLKGAKVVYSVNAKDQAGKVCTKFMSGPIKDVLETTPRTTTFEFQGKQISVADYFAKQYNVTLQNPNGLMLVIKKDCKVPAELCTIKKGQRFSRKLDELQTTNMLMIAKKSPDVLHNEIMSSVNTLKPNDVASEQARILKEFGVEVVNNMLKLDKTRVLASPELLYGKGPDNMSALITPDRGQWDIWSHSFNFFNSATELQNWGVLQAGNCKVDQAMINKFVTTMMENAASKGMKFMNKPFIFHELGMRDNEGSKNVPRLRQIFKEFFIPKGCKFVLVIIPKKNSTIYTHVKQASELEFMNPGATVLTQCVVGLNVMKAQFATVQNILLKINSKLGGENHVVLPSHIAKNSKLFNMLECPCLIIGADVTHPPPGSSIKVKGKDCEIPSFCSVTGSINKTCMPYMMDIKAQRKAGRGAAEVIQSLDEIVLNMLKAFYVRTRIRPRKIIYIRDGVGEGQFAEVLHCEMMAIRRACQKLRDFDGEPYEPKITFITVQKRHKTRMFYHNRNQVENAPPGTVIDVEIVHQTEMDFYLMSQKGMMGTSRATRYHVLWDDSLFSADEIQQLMYYMCYQYVRCNKSVKIPAPTYYAHWAAARAKALSEGMEETFDNLEDLNRRLRRHPQIIAEFPMHFV